MSHYRVTSVGHDDLPVLLAFLVSPFPASEHQFRTFPIWEALRTGRLDCRGSLAVWFGDTIVGGLLVQRQGDTMAVASMPLATPLHAPRVLPLLATALGDFCQREAITTAVFVSEDPDDIETPAMLGFRLLAPLVSLVAGEEVWPCEEPEVAVVLRPMVTGAMTPDARARSLEAMVALVDRTYEASLDFPELLIPCGAKAIIDGYRLAESHDPHQWYFIEPRGSASASGNVPPLGVLLLNDHARDRGVEIVYVGIVPEARGARIGHAVVRWTQWQARRWGRLWVFVSVDATNAPAAAVYRNTGFHEHQRKAIGVRFFGEQVGVVLEDNGF